MAKYKIAMVVSTALLLMMGVSLLTSGSKRKNTLRSDSGPPKRLRTKLENSLSNWKESLMDDMHHSTKGNGSYSRGTSAFWSRRRPSDAEIEKASAVIAREIVQAISERIDVNNPECVSEALYGLAGKDIS
jgi:hypothetical protein